MVDSQFLLQCSGSQLVLLLILFLYVSVLKIMEEYKYIFFFLRGFVLTLRFFPQLFYCLVS